jgi:hypothetical protein
MDISGVLDTRGGDEDAVVDFALAVNARGAGGRFGRDIRSLKGKLDIFGFSNERAAELTVDGNISSGRFDGRAIGEGVVSIEKTAAVVTIRRFDAEALGGKVSIRGRVESEPEAGWAFTVGYEDLALDTVLKEVMSFEKEGLRGLATGELEILSLSGEAGDAMGRAEAVVTEGALWEVPLVLAVFNVLNLRVPERAQFTEARVVCDFAGSRINIRELSMSSDPATLFGTGGIKFAGDLDMTFYSQPGKIPVISLIAGEVGRNIVKARVTGSFSSPTVRVEAAGPIGAILDFFAKPFKRPKRER